MRHDVKKEVGAPIITQTPNLGGLWAAKMHNGGMSVPMRAILPPFDIKING